MSEVGDIASRLDQLRLGRGHLSLYFFCPCTPDLALPGREHSAQHLLVVG
jgi:hypothetical protein